MDRLGGGSDGARDIVRRLTVFVCAMLVSFSAAALTSTPNTYNWHGGRMGGTGGSTPGAFPTYATFKLSRPGAPSTYAGKAFPTAFASLGGLARGAFKRLGPMVAASLIASGIMNAAGWAINELTGEVTSGGSPPQVIPPNGNYWMCGESPHTGKYFLSEHTAKTLCIQAFILRIGGVHISDRWLQESPRPYPGQWDVIYELKYTDAAGYERMTYVYLGKFVNTSTSTMMSSDVPGTAVSDAEIGQRIVEQGGAPAVDELLMQDGRVMQTPELVAAQNQVTQAVAAANGETAPPPAALEPEHTTSTAPQEKEWPGFCDWAKKVCDVIDWIKEKEPQTEAPTVPWEQQQAPEEQTWTSGLGGGSCPSTQSFSVGLGGVSQQLEFSVQPVCDFMTMMRPIFIAMATILAAFIVGGFRSNKGA